MTYSVEVINLSPERRVANVITDDGETVCSAELTDETDLQLSIDTRFIAEMQAPPDELVIGNCKLSIQRNIGDLLESLVEQLRAA